MRTHHARAGAALALLACSAATAAAGAPSAVASTGVGNAGERSFTSWSAAQLATNPLQALAQPICPPGVSYGETVECSIAAGETHSYALPDASGGDRVRARAAGISGGVTLQLEVHRDGIRICGPTSAAAFPQLECFLTGSGSYTVVVRAGAGFGDYRLHLQRLNAPVGCAGMLDYGALPVPGRIVNAPESECHAFKGVVGERIRVRRLRTAGMASYLMEVFRPDGTPLPGCLEGWTPSGQDDCRLDADGTHHVLVSAAGDGTGDYRLYLQRLNPPVGCAGKLDHGGAPVPGQITHPPESECHAFDGVAGQAIRLRRLRTAGTASYLMEVFRPDGTPLPGCLEGWTPSGQDDCQLDADGAHHVLISASGAGTGDYVVALYLRDGGDIDPPETVIGSGPRNPTYESTATFEFSSDEPDARFECRLDSGPWKPCSSPHDYTGLVAAQNRVFQVRAVDHAGNEDLTPATYNWRIASLVRIVAGTLEVQAASGLANNFRIEPVGGTLRVTDTSSLAADLPCGQVNSLTVSCPSGEVRRILVNARDASDTVVVTAPIDSELNGDAGNDTLTSGGGADTLSGGDGNDHALDGGLGADAISGGAGTDAVSYASHTVSVCVVLDGIPNDGTDVNRDCVSEENDAVDDTVENITTGRANDTLIGDGGVNKLVAGAGDDTLDGGPAADVLIGGDGTDLVDYSRRIQPVRITLEGGDDDGEAGERDHIQIIERVRGGSGDDTLIGNFTRNRLDGAGGNDTIDGGQHGDEVVGGTGNDSLDGGSEADFITGGDGVDTVDYSSRTERVCVVLNGRPNSGTDVDRDFDRGCVSEENDSVRTTERAKGGAGDDTLVGHDPDNLLEGFGGDDTLDGAAGADILDGGDGTDTVTYASRTRCVVADIDGAADDGERFPDPTGDCVVSEKDRIRTSVENLTGGSGPDHLTGRTGARNRLDGRDGDDSLTTRDTPAEADDVSCGAGFDTALIDSLDVLLPPEDCEDAHVAMGTVEDFDRDATSYVARQTNNPPPPERMAGGPTGRGRFLRLSPALAPALAPISNTITFPVTDPGSHSTVVADFDLRMAPGATVDGAAGRADGIGFALLDTAAHGTSGFVEPRLGPYAVEEPNFMGSLGVGFDIHKNDHPSLPPDQDDIGNENVAPRFTNSASIHFNGVVVHQEDVSAVTDLARGSWIHARVIVEGGTGFSPGTVSVILTACGEAATVIDRLPVPGLVPYESRAWFGARSGGESADSDIDNVNVQFLDPAESHVSLSAVSYDVAETKTSAVLTLTRTGNIGTGMSVRASTSDAGATAGSDYTGQSTTVTFLANETTKQLTVPLRDDGLAEGDEGFVVELANATGSAVVGGPSRALVTIKDDESARDLGQWSAPQCSPVVAVHSSLLPTGDVLMWDRLAQARLWTPGTGTVTAPQQPDNEVFCSGHAFTADGRLLVTGGHDDPHGSPAADGDGLSTASCYDPVTGGWSAAPDMNAGRWYPTNTTLASGEVLVTSGSADTSYRKNTLPQVWQPAGGACGSWRDLTGANELGPLGAELYPWMFLGPDGRVFKAGPDDQSWFLSTAGTGAWTDGPRSGFGLRTYGSAVQYDVGKILIVGGSRVSAGGVEAPTNTAEVIDLATGSGWTSAGSLAIPRRHLSATVLPDGTVLVTGGTRGAGFNNEATPVLAAELWDPASRTWDTLAPMKVPRTYHSTTLLLPDGRVLVAGGGQGAGAAQQRNEIEIYSPPYLFKGPRPEISSAPTAATYGQSLFIGTDQAESITRVSLVRLPSVTHSFDQNSRFMTLSFASRPGGLDVTAPAIPEVAPPGHYMLFIANAAGVPSVATILKLTAGADAAQRWRRLGPPDRLTD
jgi:Ca2+-binding RTX toxin-like protein